jgi:hypothetical protein
VGHLRDQRRPVRERRRLPTRRTQQHEALGALVDDAQERGPLGRRQIGEAVEAQPGSGQHRGQASLGHRLGLLQLADAEHQHRRAGGQRHHRPRVGAAHDQRQARLRGQQRRDLGDRLRPSDGGLGLDPAQLGCTGGAQLAGSEQEGHEPVRDLHRAVGKRGGGVRGDQPDGAAAREAAAGLKAAQDVRGMHAIAGQQLGGEPGAGQPTGDIVLEVGVEPSVAGLQLGRHAQRQHRAVQRIQAQPRDRLLEARPRRWRLRLGGQ